MEANSSLNSRRLMGLERKKKIEEEWNTIYRSKHQLSRADFPSHFIFGVATSAYQVEGGSKEGGKGPSIWDSFSHSQGKICDGSTGDVAVDQYHRYKEDIELISKLGFKAYRFSISWSRIFPDGLGTKINHEGIKYYNDIIDALLARGIEPCITLYHWDLPLNLQESFGGWLDEQIVKYFAIYAETCFASFGNRVKKWITINEPLQTAVNGHCTGKHAPGRNESSSTEPFLVAHNQLLAHAEAVSIYRNKFKCFRSCSEHFRHSCLGKQWSLFGQSDVFGLTCNNDLLRGMDDEDEDTSPLHEMLDDESRVSYFKAYLAAIHQAILDGANVRGYFAWSLLDNFEWNLGYTKRFGLIYVDFKNGLTRHLKSSVYWFMRFLKGGQVKHGKED